MTEEHYAFPPYKETLRKREEKRLEKISERRIPAQRWWSWQ